MWDSLAASNVQPRRRRALCLLMGVLLLSMSAVVCVGDGVIPPQHHDSSVQYLGGLSPTRQPEDPDDYVVQFAASLPGHQVAYIGPTRLGFYEVLENTGNSYDLATAAFTAPVPGLYVFSLHVHHFALRHTPGLAHIIKQRKASEATGDSRGYAGSSQVHVLKEPGSSGTDEGHLNAYVNTETTTEGTPVDDGQILCSVSPDEAPRHHHNNSHTADEGDGRWVNAFEAEDWNGFPPVRNEAGAAGWTRPPVVTWRKPSTAGLYDGLCKSLTYLAKGQAVHVTYVPLDTDYAPDDDGVEIIGMFTGYLLSRDL